MTETEKSRPLVAQETGQHGAGQDRADRVLVSNYTAFDGTSQQSRIQYFLGHGKSNAIPGRKLLELFGGKDLRTVSKAVEAARRDGVPVCATTSPDGPGYYIASNTDELSGYLRSLDHRLREVRITRAHLEAVLRSMAGQCVIGGWADDDHDGV